MPQRRMFSQQIVDSDAFLEMPASAQSLYFHLGMRADDDGFIDNPKKIMRMLNAGEDDMKILLAKRFLLTFESGVVVIKHWRIHNLIRTDRYSETKYLDEKKRLIIKENGAYTEVATICIPNGNQVSPSLGKVRLGKVRLGEINTCADCFKKFWELYPNKKNKQKAELKFNNLSHEIHETILKDLEERIKSIDWLKDSGQFVPHPTTYLNGARWEDEIKTAAPREIIINK